MHRLIPLLFLVIAGCSRPKDVSFSDPTVAQLLQAVDRVDRAAIGFTPIDTNSRLRIESTPRAGYDAMLHVYSSTRRTISFRRDESGYRWTGEQEVHTGPGTYETPDGPSREEVVITYHTEHTDPDATGVPLHQIHITYDGTDPRLTGRASLILNDVKTVLREWAAQQ